MSPASVSTGSLIALDWGTTNVRAALLTGDGEVIEERHGESGVGQLPAGQFGGRFDELTKDWPRVPAIAAGMVGSRQGWVEAAYLPCPTGVDGLSQNLTRFSYKGQSVAIVPGLKMDGARRHDVMRGEETQLAGLLASKPDFTGTVVQPGTHSKWVYIKHGVIEHFTTYMTGELFDVLSKHTILRHSVQEDHKTIECCRTETDQAFMSAVVDVFTGKGSNASRLFELRSQTLLKNLDRGIARSRLSGLLIGEELQAAARDGYDVQDLTLIGSGRLLETYSMAGKVLNAAVDAYKGTTLVWPALHNIASKAKFLEKT